MLSVNTSFSTAIDCIQTGSLWTGRYIQQSGLGCADSTAIVLGSFFGSYPTLNKKQDPDSAENQAYMRFQELVRTEVEYQVSCEYG